jgi:hypothetical protein
LALALALGSGAAGSAAYLARTCSMTCSRAEMQSRVSLTSSPMRVSGAKTRLPGLLKS